MKPIIALICLVFLLFIGAVNVNAEIVPTFAPAEFAYWGGSNVIMADKNGSIPNVGDWNGDGLKDMLVGVYTSGNIWYLQNTGTNAQPVFETRVLLYADGQPIAMTFG